MSFLAVREVSKRYGTAVALRSVTVEADAGSLILLSGPNGAGKSTLLRMLSGFERPDAGAVRI
ncbi:MAG: ATP-binding cassette domain-containing protein, partial [Bdellovibrionales bacterium]|nr:ATP-binding cassette domain-containing protein [Bdellovibrionales bacterium]